MTIPVVVSNQSRLSPPVSTPLCCDGQASFNFNSVKCPASSVDSSLECFDPTVFGPCIIDPLSPECLNPP